ncbi:MAG: phospholipase D family protein, partial [Chloroflexi bacterium]|nr:phospholipase D family protein [Chloroflexota bacterium]
MAVLDSFRDGEVLLGRAAAALSRSRTLGEPSHEDNRAQEGAALIVVQSQTNPATIRNAIADLIARGVIERKVAAAYTTFSGSKMLLDALAQSVGDEAFSSMPKTLVTSLDYSTTEPAALARWLALDNVTVRIAGANALADGVTTPTRAFHPKVYAFRADDQTSGVLVTSANLTGRGLTANVEAGWLQQRVPSADVDIAFSMMCEDTETLTEDMVKQYEHVRSASRTSVP